MRGALKGRTELQRLPFPADEILIKIKKIIYKKNILLFIKNPEDLSSFILNNNYKL